MKRYYVGMDVGSTYIKAALLQNGAIGAALAGCIDLNREISA